MHNLRRPFLLVLGLAVLLVALPAHANRPFSTDDSRIVENGELQLEGEVSLSVFEGQVTPMLGVDTAVGIGNVLETTVFFGIGMDPEADLTLSNPGVALKLAIVRPVPKDTVGVAFVAGVALPVGTGAAYDDATTLYGYVPLTAVNRRETIELHANVGYVIGLVPDADTVVRAHWGAAISGQVPGVPLDLIFDVGSSDPRAARGPDVEVRTGARYFGFGAFVPDAFFALQPNTDLMEGTVESVTWIVGAGATIAFPTFGGDASRSGNAHGGRGLFLPN